jgi:hypothetical protein
MKIKYIITAVIEELPENWDVETDEEAMEIIKAEIKSNPADYILDGGVLEQGEVTVTFEKVEE